MAGWKSRCWNRKDGKKLVTVKYVELWQRLAQLTQRHEIHLEHVKSHDGHIENEHCDQLAVAAYQRFLPKSFLVSRTAFLLPSRDAFSCTFSPPYPHRVERGDLLE